MAPPLRDGGLQLRPFSAGVSIAAERNAQRAVNAAAQRVRLCIGNPARLRSSQTFATAATAADEVRCRLSSCQWFQASEPSITAGRFFFFGRIQVPLMFPIQWRARYTPSWISYLADASVSSHRNDGTRQFLIWIVWCWMDQTPPGCSRYQVNLTKPLGLVLEESKAESVVVVGGMANLGLLKL